MAKSESILPLHTFMAIDPLQSITQKRLFGGKYVRVGDFWSIIGALYSSWALIGRRFKDDVSTLNQLLNAKPPNEAEAVSFLKKMVDERLQRYHLIYHEQPDSFVFFVVATEYAKVGLIMPHGNVGSTDDFKRIARAAQGEFRIDTDGPWKNVDMAAGEGTAFGLLYPALTWDIVSRECECPDPGSWNDFPRSLQAAGGIDVGELPPSTTVHERETLVLDLVKEYIKRYRPELAAILGRLNQGVLPKEL